MARPFKQGLDYFSLDCDLDDDIKFIIAKFGMTGLGIVVQLWRKCYHMEGYFCEWSEKNQYIFCLDNKIEFSQLEEVVNACFTVEIFDPRVYKESQVLTSREIQKRYLKICEEAKRKSYGVDPLYVVPPKKEVNSGLTGVSSGNNSSTAGLIPELTTQSKVKESIVKESKKNTPLSSAPNGAPDAGKKPDKKKKAVSKETPDRPYWQKLVDTYHEIYKELKKEEPSFIGRKIADFRNLYDLLRNRSRIKKVDWAEDYAVNALTNFLKEADSDKWLSDRFTIKNLVEQFDAIIARANEKSKAERKVGRIPAPQGFDQDLKFLLDRFKEPDFQLEFIDPEFYDKMTSRNLLPIGSLNKFPGDIDTQKRNAVLQFLTLNSSI
jgi:Domain of unknown function (DUF4373)